MHKNSTLFTYINTLNIFFYLKKKSSHCIRKNVMCFLSNNWELEEMVIFYSDNL